MKKVLSLTAVVLILVGVMLSGHAIAAQKATPITEKNMATLMGTWEGRADWGLAGVNPANFIMKITNDKPPFKGTVEFRGLDSSHAGKFPGNFQGATSYGPGAFENGLITNKGTLIISGEGGNFGEFSLVGADLDGWFYLWGTRGTLRLKKK